MNTNSLKFMSPVHERFREVRTLLYVLLVCVLCVCVFTDLFTAPTLTVEKYSHL